MSYIRLKMSSSQTSFTERLTRAFYSFNQKELIEIFTSIVALVFMLSVSRMLIEGFVLSTIIYSTIAVTVSFFAYLLAEKFVGQKYDCSVTYEISYNLLMIGFLISFLSNGGIVFAAPGAVVISVAYVTRIGYKYVNISKTEAGLISLSGVITSITLALLSLLLYPLNRTLFQLFLNINVFMALFNLIPLPPLDGSRIFMWSRMVWMITLVISIFLYFFGFNALFALIGVVILIITVFWLWQELYK